MTRDVYVTYIRTIGHIDPDVDIFRPFFLFYLSAILNIYIKVRYQSIILYIQYPPHFIY